MKIGDRVLVHGYIDEIRKDVIIIRNNGGYFGTIPSEVIVAPSEEEIGDCNTCRFAGCSECDDCFNGSQWAREVEISDCQW